MSTTTIPTQYSGPEDGIVQVLPPVVETADPLAAMKASYGAGPVKKPAGEQGLDSGSYNKPSLVPGARDIVTLGLLGGPGKYLLDKERTAGEGQGPTENDEGDPENRLKGAQASLAKEGKWLNPKTGKIEPLPNGPFAGLKSSESSPADTGFGPSRVSPTAPGMGGGGGMGGGAPATMPENYGYTPSEIKQHKMLSEYQGKMGGFDTQNAQYQAELEAKKAQAFQEAYQQQQALEQQAQAKEANRQAWVSSALAKHEQEAQALANEKIDPNHWFASKDTGGKITAIIGMALGGFSDIMMATPKQGPSGMGAVGQNMLSHSRDFSTWMDQMIDRDIQIQKLNLDNRYSALNMSRGLYGDRVRAFGDERIAEASAKASAWQMVGQRVMAMSQATSSDQAQVNAQKIAVQATTNQQNYELQIAVGAEKAWQARQQQIAQAQAAAAAKAVAEKKALDAKIMDWQAHGMFPHGRPVIAGGRIYEQYPDGSIHPVEKESAGGHRSEANVLMPDGRRLTFDAGSPDKSAHLTKGATELTDYIRNLQRAKIMMSGGPLGGGQVSALPTASSRGEWDSISREIAVGFKARAQLGSYDAGVERLTGAIVPTPKLGHFTDADRAKIDSQLQIANASLNNLVDQYGGNHGAGMMPSGGELQLTPQ